MKLAPITSQVALFTDEDSPAARMLAEGFTMDEVASVYYAASRMRGDESPEIPSFGIGGSSWTPGDAA